MRYTYEAVVVRDGDGWSVSFPQIPEAISQGDTMDDAVRNAADALVLALAGRIESGDVPRREHSAECVSISVDIDQDDIDETRYMTQEQACEYLGIGKSRVSQLAKSGKLEARRFGRRNMVSIASVERYAEGARRPGRPKKYVDISFGGMLKMGFMGSVNSYYPLFKTDEFRNGAVAFESGRMEDGSPPDGFVFDGIGIKRVPYAYRCDAMFRSESRECFVSVREDGKFFIYVPKSGKDEVLFEYGNFIDTLRIYIRTGAEELPESMYMV